MNIKEVYELSFLIKTRCIQSITNAITVLLNFIYLPVRQGDIFKGGSKFLMFFS